MNVSVIIIIVVALILVVPLVVLFTRRKPKSDIEIIQSKLNEAEKNIRKNKKIIDKTGDKIESFTSELLKKNDEMLKDIQDIQC